jgi:hypothetical protein
MSILDVVFLLLVANGAPILTDCLFRSRLNNALDAGFRLADGRPLFGTSKTVRGIAGAIVATSGAAVAIGYSPAIGLLVSAVADALRHRNSETTALIPCSYCRLLTGSQEQFDVTFFVRPATY